MAQSYRTDRIKSARYCFLYCIRWHTGKFLLAGEWTYTHGMRMSFHLVTEAAQAFRWTFGGHVTNGRRKWSFPFRAGNEPTQAYLKSHFATWPLWALGRCKRAACAIARTCNVTLTLKSRKRCVFYKLRRFLRTGWAHFGSDSNRRSSGE